MSERYKKAGLDALISMNPKKTKTPSNKKEETEQFFTTRLPKSLIKELKLLAVQIEKSIQSIVQEAIEAEISKHKNNK